MNIGPIWITPTGFLSTATEKVAVSHLSVLATGTSVTYQLISGKLPPGLILNSNGTISGAPDGVLNTTRSTFVVRATDANKSIVDGTFSIDIFGPAAPNWVTTSGYLTVGINSEPYAINNQYVNYQLSAEPFADTSSTLSYFIANGGGQLPPGLSLSGDGVISGFLTDSLVFDGLQAAGGGYDSESFDGYSYDHYADTTSTSIGLPKIYNFRVTASDGISNTASIFKILVLSPPMIQNPTAIPVQWPTQFVCTGTITTASSTITNIVSYNITKRNHGLHSGQWVTINNLTTTTTGLGTGSYYIGVISANTVTLYTDNSLTNIVSVSPSTYLLGSSTFVCTASINSYLVQQNVSYLPPLQFIKGTDLGVIKANNSQDIDVSAYDPYPKDGVVTYTITTTTDVLTQLPPDLSLDSSRGLLYGLVPYQPAYTRTYNLTINATRVATTASGYSTASTYASIYGSVTSTNIFSLAVKGEVESTIAWVTDSNLGSISTGIPSELFVQAKQLNSTYSIKYQQTSGTIPPGLTLERDGTLTGAVNYGSTGTYTFGVVASDVYGLSAISKTFTLNVTQKDTAEYTKIYVCPFLSESQRSLYQDFITNEFTFDPSLMYRYYDSNFGVQNQIKMILEFGIERENLSVYTNALRENFYRKRLYFGDVKVAVAKDSTGTEIYEVVYVDIVDDQVNSNGQSASSIIYNKNNIYYPASVDNMRKQLETIVLPNYSYIGINNDYLPKFMETAQAGSYQLPGYMRIVPLCYTTPGNGAKIVSRINISGFDFKTLDFEIDRLIVESSLDSTTAKYLIFERQSIGDQIPEDNFLFGPDEVELVDQNNDPLQRE